MNKQLRMSRKNVQKKPNVVKEFDWKLESDCMVLNQ